MVGYQIFYTRKGEMTGLSYLSTPICHLYRASLSWMRQNGKKNGIRLSLGEDKVPLFADDTLIYLGHPSTSLQKLSQNLNSGLTKGYQNIVTSMRAAHCVSSKSLKTALMNLIRIYFRHFCNLDIM